LTTDGSGFRILDLVGLGFGLQGFKFRVWCSGYGVWWPWFRVQGSTRVHATFSELIFRAPIFTLSLEVSTRIIRLLPQRIGYYRCFRVYRISDCILRN